MSDNYPVEYAGYASVFLNSTYSLGIGIARPSQDRSIAIAIPIAIASRFQCPRRSSAASDKPMPNALMSESFTVVNPQSQSGIDKRNEICNFRCGFEF